MDAEEALARREAWQERRRAKSARTQAKIQTGLAVLWVALATIRWFDDEAEVWLKWAWTALAVGYAVLATSLWRKVRRDRPESGD